MAVGSRGRHGLGGATVDQSDIRGLVTTGLDSSRGCLALRTSVVRLVQNRRLQGAFEDSPHRQTVSRAAAILRRMVA
jgi:hypothetical protein